MSAKSDYPSSGSQHSATLPPVANKDSALADALRGELLYRVAAAERLIAFSAAIKAGCTHRELADAVKKPPETVRRLLDGRSR